MRPESGKDRDAVHGANRPRTHHRGHTHGVDRTNERRVLWALVLTGSFMVVEVAGGIISGSLALLADAGHMLTDTAALALAWASFRVARRPQDTRRTYGYHRFQIIAAFVNGITLFAIVGWIAFEATRRLLAPTEVMGVPMLVVAGAGLVVNIIAFAILHGGARENLNVEGAALHVLGDLMGSVAAIAAAIVILWTGWMPIDPLLSIFVALLIVRSAWRLTRRSVHVLLEGAPEWMNEEELKSELIKSVPQVRSVHHLHAWMLTLEQPLVTLHAEIGEGDNHHEILLAIKRFLREYYAIDHATIQLESGGCVDQAHDTGT